MLLFPIPCLLFVCVILTMSSVHRRQHELSLPLQQIKYQETILSSQAARHKAHRAPSSLKYSPSHFLSQVHTLCDKQFPRLKTFRPPKKRQLLSSLWLVTQSTLCSYPAPLPRQRAALRSKWCGDQDGFNCAPVTEYQIALPWVLLSYPSMKFSALGIWNHWQ